MIVPLALKLPRVKALPELMLALDSLRARDRALAGRLRQDQKVNIN